VSAAAECSRALALLIEARQILEQLVEDGKVEDGSPPEATLGPLEDAIGMLTPDDDNAQEPPRLRIVGGTGA
jgi:hypothetical protein